MSIKGKLIFVLSVTGVLLAYLAGLMTWNVVQVSRQVDNMRPKIDYLHEAGRLRLRFYQQTHSLLRYMYYDDDIAKTAFKERHQEIINAFPHLRDAALKERSIHTPSSSTEVMEQHDLMAMNKIEDSYYRINALAERIFGPQKPIRGKAARQLVNKQVQHEIGDVFFKEIDESINRKADEILGAYDNILLRMGVLPWIRNASLSHVRGTRLSIQYYLAVDRLSLSLNRGLNEIADYFLSGSFRNQHEYETAGLEIEQALQECRRIIQAQIAFGMEGEEEKLSDLNDLEREYQMMAAIMVRAQTLKSSGKTMYVTIPMENRLKPFADNSLLMKLERIMTNSRAEITLDHRILLRSIYIAGIASIALILIVASVLFLLIYQVLGRLLLTIKSLSRGAEIIGSGDLDHRIAVETSDELGGLANSFNRMTTSLKDSNDDLRFFIYSLSHDLRSPLVNIKGFSGEMSHVVRELDAIIERSRVHIAPEDRERLEALVLHEIPQTLGFIEEASQRINELVNAVLKLSFVGQVSFKPEPVDMDKVVRTCINSFAEEMEQKQISVHVGSLPTVIADRSAVEEIVGNIIDNALKYLSPERRGHVDISGKRTEGEVVLNFRDNGRGIAKDDVSKIFGLFRRVGEQNIPGDGMGLAYVKMLVRRHGGRIWCESEAGVGTTFSVSFPFTSPLQNQRV